MCDILDADQLSQVMYIFTQEAWDIKNGSLTGFSDNVNIMSDMPYKLRVFLNQSWTL